MDEKVKSASAAGTDEAARRLERLINANFGEDRQIYLEYGQKPMELAGTLVERGG